MKHLTLLTLLILALKLLILAAPFGWGEITHGYSQTAPTAVGCQASHSISSDLILAGQLDSFMRAVPLGWARLMGEYVSAFPWFGAFYIGVAFVALPIALYCCSLLLSFGLPGLFASWVGGRLRASWCSLPTG